MTAIVGTRVAVKSHARGVRSFTGRIFAMINTVIVWKLPHAKSRSLLTYQQSIGAETLPMIVTCPGRFKPGIQFKAH